MPEDDAWSELGWVARRLEERRNVFVDPVFQDIADACRALLEARAVYRELKELHDRWDDSIDEAGDDVLVSLLYEFSDKLSYISAILEDVDYLVSKAEDRLDEAMIRDDCPPEYSSTEDCRRLRELQREYSRAIFRLLREMHRLFRADSLLLEIFANKVELECEARGILSDF